MLSKNNRLKKQPELSMSLTNEEIDQYFADRQKRKPKKIIPRREDMGLDMYLYRRDKDGEILSKSFDHEVDGYETEFIYWRKMNAIHRWFVKHVQNGTDDCGTYPIPTETLIFFYDELVQARLKRDPTIFPPQEGFFFGSTTTDEYYWREIRDTIEKLKPEIEAIKEDKKEHTYFYESSW